MPFKVTTKGRIKLKRAGALISEHTQETEAFESAIRHAEANGSGLYTVESPVRELDVSVLARVVIDPDTTPPTVPGLVAATALSQTVIRVTWTASTDSGGSGLAGYRVLHSTTSGGTYTQIGSDLSVASLTYDDAGLAAGSTHFYRIVAFDGRNNVSSQSSTASATTQASNPNTGLTWPPHAPGYVSLLPDVGGYAMNTVAGSGRHLGTPATAVILINSLAGGNTGGAISGHGANVFAGTEEYAWRHAASSKAIIPIVSGWVQIQDGIPCQTGTPPRPGYVTYYGQFAPNPGLFLRGANMATNGASNFVAWHLRSYMGDDVAGLPAGNRDCFSSGYAAGTTSSVVLINCEFAWSVDELADFNRSHSQVTMVNCAFIEPLHRSTVVHPEDGAGVDHGFGPIIGSDTGNPVQTSSVSLFRNLFAHTTGRNPMISAQSFVHANNLHYNHGRPTGGQGNAVQIISAGATEANFANILGNAFIRGPNNDGSLVSISVTGTYPAGSGAYSFANAQFGWTSPANQAGFFTSAPAGYVASSLQSAAFPGSWGSIAAVLQWAANPLSPTAAEWKGFVDLMEGTVGAQPRWRTASIGRVKTVLNQIRDRLNGVSQSNQFVDTVTQAGGWFTVPTVTIDPLNPGTHWHAPLPTGSDRDTPYTTGVFGDGKSRVGYTRLEAWAYEQHLYVTQVDLVSPTIPVSVTVTPLSTTALRVAWDASTDSGGSGLAGYRVYRSTTSGGTYTQVGSDLSASALSFDDGSLSSGQTRFYRVVAFDGAGNASSQSATASGTTQTSGGVGEWGGRTPTHYVTAAATGSGNGTLGSPWTMAQALSAAVAGNVIGVAAGVYTRSGGTLNIPAFNVTNSGASGNPIVFQAQWPAIGAYASSLRSKLTNGVTSGNGPTTMGVTGRNYVQWDGFWVDEAVSRAQTGIGPAVLVATTGSAILRCRIDGVQIDYSNDNHSGIWADQAVSCQINSNYIRNIRPPSGSSVNSAGIFFWSCRDVQVRNNLIEDCNTGMYVKYNHAGTGFGGIDIRLNRFTRTSTACRVADQSTTGTNPSFFVQNLIVTSDDGFNFSFGTDTAVVPRLWTVSNNTFVDVSQGFYVGFQNTTSMADCLILNNLHDAGTRFVYWDDNNTAIAGMTSRGMLWSYNSTRSVTNYMRTATSTYSTPAATQSAIGHGTGGQQFSAGATIFTNRSGGDYTLAVSSPARTASNTSGPVGCYITGTETIGLLAA